MSVKDPFSIDRCCQESPTALQNLSADYYTAIGTYVDNIMTELYQAEMYGKDTEIYYDMLNDFHYLYTLLILIYQEMQNDAIWEFNYGTGCNQSQTVDYYLEKYNINCIQKHFFCYGYDIADALNVFGLNPDMQEQDGIGFMYIEFDSPVACETNKKPFRVF
jgi:hypothetical protein